MGGYVLAALTGMAALWGGVPSGGAPAMNAGMVAAHSAVPDLEARANELMARFFDESVPDEDRIGVLRPLGGMAKKWLDESRPPLAVAQAKDARVVSTIVRFFSAHSGNWIAPVALDGFYRSWFGFVEADHSLGGAFASVAFPNELSARVRYLTVRGDLGAYLALLGEKGRYSMNLFEPSERALQFAMRAEVYRTLGSFDLALRDVDHSSDLASDLDWLPKVAAADSKAKLEVDLGRLDEARVALARVDRILNDHGAEIGPSDRMRQNLGRARFLLATGENELATEVASHAIREFQPGLAPSAMDLGLIDRARATRLLGEARVLLRDGTDTKTLRAKLHEGRELLAGYDNSVFSRAVLRLTVADLLHALEQDRDALTELDALSETVRLMTSPSISHVGEPESRGLPLLDMRIESRRYEVRRSLGEAGAAAPALRDAFDRLLGAWSKIAIHPSGVGFLEFSDRRRALELVLDSIHTSDIESPIDALAFLLRADACSTVARQLGAPEVTPKELMTFCAEEGVVLVYVVPTEWSTYRFLIGGTDVSLVKLEAAPEFQSRLGPVLDSLRQRPTNDEPWPTGQVARNLEWLGQRLVPDVPDEVQLVFVGTEGFGICPVEVLTDEAGSPIGLNREVVRLPALSALAALRERADRHTTKSRHSLRMFALSGAQHTFDPIDLRLAEDRELRDVSNADVRFTRGKAATAEGFVNALASGPELFVAWTHGAMSESVLPSRGLVVLDPEAPSVAGTRVIASDFVTDALTNAAAASVPLVALIAACHLNEGPRRTGDTGAGTFVGSLIASGVPVVIAGSESLDREASMQFVLGFSKAFLGEGASVGQAALAARRRVAHTAGMSHPHFWSPLQVTGFGKLRLSLPNRTPK